MHRLEMVTRKEPVSANHRLRLIEHYIPIQKIKPRLLEKAGLVSSLKQLNRSVFNDFIPISTHNGRLRLFGRQIGDNRAQRGKSTRSRSSLPALKCGTYFAGT